MEKEFIPYEQALALKELGFDEPCFTKFEDYFNKTKLYPILATLHLNTPYENEYNGYDKKITNDQSKRWFFTGYKNSVKNHNNDILSAPTFSQAFRWFREKYGLHRHICYFNDTNVWHGDIYKIQNEGLMNNPMELTNYKTYEEAELACLTKLIELVKSK